MPDVRFSNQYPYTDFHELNLDWVIKEVKFWSERVGKSIQKIELTGTVGLVDTYTITYSDGTTSTFDVTNGNGIASVAKTGTVGLVDTYTITFQDGTTSTFDVTNGAAAVVQTTGSNTSTVMSQDAVTDEFKDFGDMLRGSLTWTTGVYDMSTGVFDSSITSYKSTQWLNSSAFDFISGYPYASGFCFISLKHNGTYKGSFYSNKYHNTSGTVVAAYDFDEFALNVYLTDIPYPEIEISLNNIENVYNNLNTPLTWSTGAYLTNTGVFDSSVTTYKATQWINAKLYDLISGFPYNTGNNFISLKYQGVYKGAYYYNAYHNPAGTVVPAYDFDEFALNAYLAEIPNPSITVQIVTLAGLQDEIDILNTKFERHTEINVSTAAELIAAIDNIATTRSNNKASKMNQYDIYLASGTYNIYPALNLSRADNADQPFHRGLEIPDYVNLYGIGDVTINCTIPEADNSSDHPYSFIISVINVYGSNKFYNLNLIGDNTKYVIHDDSYTYEPDRYIEMTDCTLIHNGMASADYWTTPYVYGAGYDTNRRGAFKRCSFKHVNYGVFYVHTSGGANLLSPCSVTLEECVIDAPVSFAIYFQIPWNTNNGSTGSLTVKNCCFLDNKDIKLDGVLPGILYGGGNTSGLIITNNNSSKIYLINS